MLDLGVIHRLVAILPGRGHEPFAVAGVTLQHALAAWE
jgi:hypothetical protein